MGRHEIKNQEKKIEKREIVVNYEMKCDTDSNKLLRVISAGYLAFPIKIAIDTIGIISKFGYTDDARSGVFATLFMLIYPIAVVNDVNMNELKMFGNGYDPTKKYVSKKIVVNDTIVTYRISRNIFNTIGNALYMLGAGGIGASIYHGAVRDESGMAVLGTCVGLLTTFGGKALMNNGRKCNEELIKQKPSPDIKYVRTRSRWNKYYNLDSASVEK